MPLDSAVPVLLSGLVPKSVVAEVVSGKPVNVETSVISSRPDDALAMKGAAPLALLNADTSPARSVVAVSRVTGCAVAPRLTVNDRGVTSKSYRVGPLAPCNVEAVPAAGGTADAKGV